MSGTHARLAPSSAGRWGPGGCPASPAMEARYPEPEDSEAAREGTAAHFYVSETLLGRACPVGTIAPNGVPINSEMIDSAAEILHDVRSILANEATPGIVARVEEKVSMIESVHPDNDGTPDVYILDLDKRLLWLRDYKYGHRYVDVFKCWQLINYVIGILESNGIPMSDWGGWRIDVAIAQPRCFSGEGTFRSWGFGGMALIDFAGQLKKAAYEASQPDAPCRTGSHCRDCSAIVPCEANQKAAGICVDLANRQVAADLTPMGLGFQRKMITRAIEMLKARDDGLEAQMLGLIAQGRTVPFWRHEATTGRERWKLPLEDVIPAIKMIEGVDISKPAALTPTQARKAGVDASVIDEYSERPSGAMKLKPVDESDYLKQLGSR